MMVVKGAIRIVSVQRLSRKAMRFVCYQNHYRLVPVDIPTALCLPCRKYTLSYWRNTALSLLTRECGTILVSLTGVHMCVLKAKYVLRPHRVSMTVPSADRLTILFKPTITAHEGSCDSSPSPSQAVFRCEFSSSILLQKPTTASWPTFNCLCSTNVVERARTGHQGSDT